MEPKKNPKYDVHRKRGVIFNISLIVSLALVISAFQWAVPNDKPIPPLPKPITDTELYVVPVTAHEHKKEAAVKPKRIAAIKPVPSTVITEVDDKLKQVATTVETFDQMDTSTYVETVEVPVENVGIIDFRVVEKKPEPEGGAEGFQKLLRKNLKYPKRAIHNDTEGSVYVSFTISTTGVVSDLKILKGIGDGCDEEAMRVIALSKWTPGKQRGNPVAVRMIQPITFSLGKQ